LNKEVVTYSVYQGLSIHKNLFNFNIYELHGFNVLLKKMSNPSQEENFNEKLAKNVCDNLKILQQNWIKTNEQNDLLPLK